MKVRSSLFKKRYPGKKVFLLVYFACFLSCVSFSQNFITLYTPGYQLSHFKATGVRLDDAGTLGNVKGNINHLLFKGDGIVNNMVFGCDVSLLFVGLIKGLNNGDYSYYASAFDVRYGAAFELGDATKIGAAVGFGVTGIDYDQDNIDFRGQYKYYTLGITFVGLHAIEEKIYIMPKLSFNPMFGKDVDKITDGMSFKFETSIGYRFLGGLGFSITPGIERMKFLYLGETEDHQEEVRKTQINTSFLHFGISFMLD